MVWDKAKNHKNYVLLDSILIINCLNMSRKWAEKQFYKFT